MYKGIKNELKGDHTKTFKFGLDLRPSVLKDLQSED